MRGQVCFLYLTIRSLRLAILNTHGILSIRASHIPIGGIINSIDRQSCILAKCFCSLVAIQTGYQTQSKEMNRVVHRNRVPEVVKTEIRQCHIQYQTQPK